jgi:DNA anti-recombination protein RmuC
MWSCLKTHDVMSGYIDHQFENHPAISAEYVKFLATNSGSEKVEKIDGVVASLSEKLNKSLEETKKAVRKADVATAKLSDLLKEVQSLAKKVKQLEDKAGR